MSDKSRPRPINWIHPTLRSAIEDKFPDLFEVMPPPIREVFFITDTPPTYMFVHPNTQIWTVVIPDPIVRPATEKEKTALHELTPKGGPS